MTQDPLESSVLVKVQVGVQCDSIGLPRERWQRTFDSVCGTPSLTHVLEDEWEFLRQTEEVLKLGYWGAPSGRREQHE